MKDAVAAEEMAKKENSAMAMNGLGAMFVNVWQRCNAESERRALDGKVEGVNLQG